MYRYLRGRVRHQAGRTAALMLGILMATASFVVLTGAAHTTQRLYRVDNTWIFDRGLSRAADASDFVYVTRSPVDTPQVLEANGITASETVAGRRVPVCQYPGTLKGPGPFAVSVRADIDCFSPANNLGQPGVVTQWSFPLLIAAIDPVAEARLDGLNRAMVSGRYLRAGDALTPVSQGGVPGNAIPVLSPVRSYTDPQLEQTLWRLPAAAAQAVVDAPLAPATAQQRFGTTRGTLISRTVIDASSAYDDLLAQIRLTSPTDAGAIDTVWTPGPVSYAVTRHGALRPRTVTNPSSI